MSPGFSQRFLKTVFLVALSLLMLGLGVQFFLQEGVQLVQVRAAFELADRRWLYFGLVLSVGYIWLHSEMYRLSFKSLGMDVSLRVMMRLYLKRNFVSVFLPAGFISSQAFFSKEVIRSEKLQEADVLSASGVFSVAALLSSILVVVPALGWLLTQHILPGGAAEAFLTMSALIGALLWALVSFTRHRMVFRWCSRYLPALTARLEALEWSRFQAKYLLYAILVSCVVEGVGVAHVWVALRTLGGNGSLSMAFAGYLAVLIVLMTSPFLRGVGAVEALLALVLIKFGQPAVMAVSAALLFRFFEFWLVLLLAIPALLFRPGSLVIRVAPAILLFLLGAVGILSGLTPTLPERAGLLKDYLPLEALHASAALTVVTGFVLLGTAIYLFRGLRSAWWLALGMSVVALFSHLLKGFDYEEATLALFTIGALMYQRGQYNVKTDFKLIQRGWLPALIVVATTMILGTVGFFLLDHRHFGADFSIGQSILYAFQTFLLMDLPGLHPFTVFGSEFLGLMHLLGGLTLLFLAYSVFRPYLPIFENQDLDREKAVELVKQYGNSSLDYFKTYSDKQFFFPKNGQSFVAYKSTARYALALENPVAPNETAVRESVHEFDRFCRRNGLRSIYFRIPESSAALYRSIGKSLLPLGQEAILSLTDFSMEGKERKALRNTLHKMDREGFKFVMHTAPLNSRLLQQLRAVSDDWLRTLHRSELSFSQGFFKEEELRNQTVLTLENADGKILAFLNLIPGATPQEANFDLMRRTEDAPGGAMDFLFTNMFLHLKNEGFSTCNLGLVPMSGLDNPSTLSENLLKLAYERVPRFASYKSLRFFKEKFNPVWETKYIAYDSQLDLMNLPIVLDQVIQA